VDYLPPKKGSKKKTDTTIEQQIHPEDFVKYFSRTVFDTLQMIHNHPSYTPFYSNSLMKDMNISPYKPTSDDVKKWLEYPANYEQELSRLSQYLEGVVMQYERTIYHFASLLDFNYYIYPITQVPNPKEDKNAFKKYRKSKNEALDWLRKFRPKEQFFNATLGVIREGGKYYYIRESNDFIDLQELPADHCTIDGRTSPGYTFSFNMAFFLRAPQALNSYAPEFQEWFKDFYQEWQQNKNIVYYKKMPPEKSLVVLFDDTRAARLSPLRALYKDIMDVVEYKQLLKTKALLDTYKIIHMQIPRDKDGKLLLDYKMAAQWVAQLQASLPYGAIALCSPMESQELKVSDNQYINILGSLLNDQYWKSAGVSPLAFGSDNGKSIASVKASNISDTNFIDHLYQIYTKFINYQLSLKTGKFLFGVKIFGDSFSRDEIVNRYRNSAALGLSKKEYYASLNKEPFEYEQQMDDITLFNWDTQAIVPLSTSYTMSGDSNDLGGRPTNQEAGKELTDNGEQTASGGYNNQQ